MEKECEFYRRLLNEWNALDKPFNIAINAIASDAAIFIDIEQIRESCNTVFDFLSIRKRFSELSKCNCNLGCDEHGFMLEGHSFETLDEVERALKMKAFL